MCMFYTVSTIFEQTFRDPSFHEESRAVLIFNSKIISHGGNLISLFINQDYFWASNFF